MKLATDISEVEQFDIVDETEFTVDSSVHMMKILSGLYEDIPWAIVREYGTNMKDAYNFLPEGSKIIPPEISVPTRFEPWIEFKDYGVGMPVEMVKRVFTAYGKSTKTNNNIDAGGLGLGAKAAFCYTDGDQWSVESRYNGTKTHYALYKNNRGFPALATLGEDVTDEPNGITVRIPVKPQHIYDFTAAVKKFARYFTMPLKIISTNNEVIPDAKPIYVYSGDTWGLVQERGTYTVIMGNVPYPIDPTYFQNLYDKADYKNNHHSVHFTVPIGAVEFLPNREALQYNDKTVSYLRTLEAQMLLELSAQIQKDVDKCQTEWDVLLFVKQLNTLGTHIKSKLAVTFGDNESIMQDEYISREFFDAHCVTIREKKARLNNECTGTEEDDDEFIKVVFSINTMDNKRVLITPHPYKSKEFMHLVRKVRAWMEEMYFRRSYSGAKRHSTVGSADYCVVSTTLDKTAMIVKCGGYPNVIEESDIPTLTKVAKTPSVRTKTKVKRYSVHREEWDDADVTIEDGGYYVPLERNEIMNFNGHFHTMIKSALKLKLIDDDLVIYGIPRTHKHMETKEGWEPLLPLLKDSVLASIDVASAAIQASWEWRNFDRNNYRNTYIRNAVRSLSKHVPEFAEIQKYSVHADIGALWYPLVSGFAIPHTATEVTTKSEIDDALEALREKFPMLMLLIDEGTYDFTTDQLKMVLDYVALCR